MESPDNAIDPGIGGAAPPIPRWVSCPGSGDDGSGMRDETADGKVVADSGLSPLKGGRRDVDRVVVNEPRRAMTHSGPVDRLGKVVLRLLPRDSRAVRILRRAMLTRVSRQLHRVLRDGGLLEHVWVTGGLALGYARGECPLQNDLCDIDLGFAHDDYRALMRWVPSLVQRGFEPLYKLQSNHGVTTVMRFRKGGVWVDFLRYAQRGDQEHSITYLTDPVARLSEDHPDAEKDVEIEQAVTRQLKVPAMRLFGRVWYCPRDLPKFVAELYGDWDVEPETFYRRAWHHVTHSPAIVRREVWHHSWIPWDYRHDPDVRAIPG